MSTVTRKQLLKSGAGGAVALGALAAPSVVLGKRPEDGIAIHAHGVVTRPSDGFNLAISPDVAGRADSLAGAGWDSGAAASSPTMVPTNVVGACY